MVTYGRTVIESLTATTPADSWQVGHAYAQLSRLNDAAGTAGDTSESPLGLAEVRALLADGFRGRASRANFRTGTLTIATLHPMRSVPRRSACWASTTDCFRGGRAHWETTCTPSGSMDRRSRSTQ